MEVPGTSLERSQSTISREVARNSEGEAYRPDEAQRKAGERRHAASAVPRKLTDRVREIVVSKLRLRWSPEQIAGSCGSRAASASGRRLPARPVAA